MVGETDIKALVKEALFDEYDTGLEQVSTQITGTWRWGVNRKAVYKSIEDNTFWQITYRETIGDNSNGLEEDLENFGFKVQQVYPKEVNTIIYECV